MPVSKDQQGSGFEPKYSEHQRGSADALQIMAEHC